MQATTEIRKTAALAPHAPTLTRALTALLDETAVREHRYDQALAQAIDRLAPHLTAVFGPTWPAAALYQDWYRRASHRLTDEDLHTAARTAATLYTTFISHDPDALRRHTTDPNWATREAAVRRSWRAGPTTGPPWRGCASAPPPTTTRTCGRRRCRRSRRAGPTTRPL